MDDEIAATDRLLQVIRGRGGDVANRPPAEGRAPSQRAQPEMILSPRVKPKKVLISTPSRVKVGLDIGSHTIKMVQLERTGRAHRLLGFGLVEVNAAKRGPEYGLEARLKAIERVLAGVNLGKALIVTSITDPSLIIRQVSMPKMPLKDLERAVSFEARRHIPLDASEVKLTYQVLERKRDSSVMEVLLVAVPTKVLDEHLSMLSRAGISPHVVDVAPLALINAYLENRKVIPGETVVLLHMGASVTYLNVYREDGPFFSRMIPISGNHFTKELEKRLRTGYGEAERIKKNPALMAKADQGGGAPDKALIEALASPLEKMLLEIRRSLTFYDNNNGKQGFSKVVISGGSAAVKGMADFLADELALPLETFDPFQRIEIDEECFPSELLDPCKSRLTLAVGLAIRQ